MSQEKPKKPEPAPFSEPTHGDYVVLSEIMNAMAQRFETNPEMGIADLIESVVDRESVAFVALRSALDFMQIKDGAEMMQRMDEAMRLALFWSGGVYVGYQFRIQKESA